MSERIAHPRVPVLTIAGSDPSGGAGLQADLKTFHQHGVYGMAAVTLLTVQNTRSVTHVVTVDAPLVHQQICTVLDDIPPAAIKTGALGNSDIIRAVASLQFEVPLVVDPVMVSKHGHALLEPEAQQAFRTLLLPRATLLTPNTHEAAALLGRIIATVEDADEAAKDLCALGPQAVLIKGGHLTGDTATDVLCWKGRISHFSSPRIDTQHTHGTGCTYSAAITAHLALGRTLEEAVQRAKAWLSQAIATAPGLGHGLGPLNHFASNV